MFINFRFKKKIPLGKNDLSECSLSLSNLGKSRLGKNKATCDSFLEPISANKPSALTVILLLSVVFSHFLSCDSLISTDTNCRGLTALTKEK